MKRLLIIQAHPDGSETHLCHALAQSYVEGALDAGHEVRAIELAGLQFPLLRSQREWMQGPLPDSLVPAQDAVAWAEHLVLFFPLWLGDMPALLKGFLEQIARPGFAFSAEGGNPFSRKKLTGRSARVVVTMGMPALVYRWYFRAHSVKSLERNILGFVGISPVDQTFIGQVESLDEKGVARWRERLRTMGRDAA